MSVWQAPKTNWQNGDYFNLSPDYQRIKGNIEYLYEISQLLYPSYKMYELYMYTIDQFPRADFFNTIVYDIDLINSNTLGKNNPLFKTMRTYVSNGTIWDKDDLNIIEENTKMLFRELKEKHYDNVPRLSIKLGAKKF
jgi:hypothetical protein